MMFNLQKCFAEEQKREREREREREIERERESDRESAKSLSVLQIGKSLSCANNTLIFKRRFLCSLQFY